MNYYLALHGTMRYKGLMSESLQVQLKKGVLEMCVLALLSKGDNYAYEIASQMAEAVGMGEGTIYPLMRRMQNDGLVTTYLQESASGAPPLSRRNAPNGTRSKPPSQKYWETRYEPRHVLVRTAHGPFGLAAEGH